MKISIRSMVLALLCIACTDKAQAQEQTQAQLPQQEPAQEQFYTNPVVNRDLPDPTIIKADDGYFYIYATGRLVNIVRSRDLVNWENAGTAFLEAERPELVPGAGIWAPDINIIDGKYVMYYSMSTWGGIRDCGIGVAVSDSPGGPFKDLGKLFISTEIGVLNSIDPFYIEDHGAKYLFWGSWYGIHGIELSADGLSLKPDAGTFQIAGTAFEATYIHKKNGFYYLMPSIGSCCEGIKSTYELVAGRSGSLFGPYLDKGGKDMMDNGYTVIIGKNNRFVGNGHCSEIVTDDAGRDWIFYHGVDTEDPKGRKLVMSEVKWDEDGWPYVEGRSPAVTAPAPVID